jgi:hypothetical protein
LSQFEKELELLLNIFILLENAGPAGSRSHGAGFLDASHNHAHMGRFHYNDHPLGLQNIVNCLGNLLRQTFLDLQSPRVNLRNSSQL